MNKVEDILIYETLGEATISIMRNGKRKHYTNQHDIDRLLSLFNSENYQLTLDSGIVSGCLIVRVGRKPKQEYFEITSVHRDDLERLGFDVANVDDSTMLRLASKMSDSYTASGEFWAELAYHGEMLDIPRPNPKDIYDDENDTFENDRRMPDWSISEDDDIQWEPLDQDSDDD